MRELRPYQQQAIEAVFAAEQRGVNRPLIAMATGLGKTLLAAEMIRRRMPHGRAIFFAPIDEVVFQNARAVQAQNHSHAVGIVKAALNQKNADIVIASLHTLRKKARLAQMGQDFQTVIVDECHLNLDAYKDVIAHVAAPGALIVGLSATPYRLDGRGLDEVFQEIVFDMPLIEGIAQGYLCEPDGLQFRLKGVDFSQTHLRKGDLDQNEIAEFIKRAEDWDKQMFAQWAEHARDKRTAVFLPKVEMAYQFAEYMRSQGVAAMALDGKTKKAERREILKRYEQGELQVLVNVLVLSTGWDSPWTECLLMGTLTASLARYMQTLGRGTRLLPGVIDGLGTPEQRLAAIAASAKPNFLLLDMAGVTKRHKPMSLATLAGVEKPNTQKKKFSELLEDAKKEAKAKEIAEQQAKAAAEERERITAEFEARRVDVLNRYAAKPVSRERHFAWQFDLDGSRTLAVGEVTITVRPMAGGFWMASDKARFREIRGTAEECQRVAEQHASTLFFSDRNAPWRARPATAKQINKLRQWRIQFRDGITAGEASDLMSEFINRQKRAKASAA